MNYTKRLVCVLLVLALALTLAACGKKSEAPASSAPESTTPAGGNSLVSNRPTAELDPARVAPLIPADSEFAGGDGTQASPYQIATAGQLALLAKRVNEEELQDNEKWSKAWYELTADIEVNDTTDFADWEETAPQYSWSAIGNYSSYARFRGHFNGGGHTISGLYCYGKYESEEGIPGADYAAGLFGSIQDATVENVILDRSYICRLDGYSGGGIVYNAWDSVIENCQSAAVIRCLYASSNPGVGGVVGGVNESTIRNCVFTGDIRVDNSYGDGHVGGIAGSAMGATLENCENRGAISSVGSNSAGGILGCGAGTSLTAHKLEFEIVGYLGTTLVNCTNYGTVTTVAQEENDHGGENAGGITGAFDCSYGGTDYVIRGCKNYGVIDSAEIGGGIVGYLHCRKTSVANPDGRPGAVLIENCENYGDITGEREEVTCGGILGFAGVFDGGDATVRNCANLGTVACSSAAGGIHGYLVTMNGATLRITQCKNEAAVTSADSQAAGILASISQNGTEGDTAIQIDSCSNSGLITGGGWAMGGILGMTISFAKEGDSLVIDRCTNTGDLYSDSTGISGGIAGDLSPSYQGEGKETLRISGCENTGNITVERNNVEPPYFPAHIGQIVGNIGQQAEVTGCSGSGKITQIINGEIQQDTYGEIGFVKS